MIVDTHVHVISRDRGHYPYTPDERGLGEWVESHPVTVEELVQELDGAGVDRALLVQASSAYGYANAYAADSAQQHRDRFVGLCIIDMLAPDAPQRLNYWVETRGMRGIRLFTTPNPDAPWIDDPRTLPVWEKTLELGIPLTVQIHARHLPRLSKMIEQFPDLPVALDHLANAQLVATASPPPELLALADLPNLYSKFSTVNLDAAQQRATVADYFGPLLERFGAQRLMWSSNYPATHDRSYADMLQLAREAFAYLPRADQEHLFGETALSLWSELRGERATGEGNLPQ